MGERNDFNVVLGILTEYRGFQPAENADLSVSKDVFMCHIPFCMGDIWQLS